VSGPEWLQLLTGCVRVNKFDEFYQNLLKFDGFDPTEF
jgi:hypothetical protein